MRCTPSLNIRHCQGPAASSPCCAAAICTLWVLPGGGATPSPPLGLGEGATWLMTPTSPKAPFRAGCSLATRAPDNWFTGENLDFLQAGFLFLPFSFLFLLFKQSDLDYDEVLVDFSQRCWFYLAWLAWTPSWTSFLPSLLASGLTPVPPPCCSQITLSRVQFS